MIEETHENTAANAGKAQDQVERDRQLANATGRDPNPRRRGDGTGVKPAADPNYDSKRDEQTAETRSSGVEEREDDEARRADGSHDRDAKDLTEATVSEMEAGRAALKKHQPLTSAKAKAKVDSKTDSKTDDK